jgi:hypothetical protein
LILLHFGPKSSEEDFAFLFYCLGIGLFQFVLRKDFSTAANALPVEFKIQVALRILGRNNTADDTNELSGHAIGESTCNDIFKTFVARFSSALYYEFVNESEGQDLLNVMEMYRTLGLPGAIGSMDCTHVMWGRCPLRHRWESIGKPGKPSIAFQCVVDHNRRMIWSPI